MSPEGAPTRAMDDVLDDPNVRHFRATCPTEAPEEAVTESGELRLVVPGSEVNPGSLEPEAVADAVEQAGSVEQEVAIERVSLWRVRDGGQVLYVGDDFEAALREVRAAASRRSR